MVDSDYIIISILDDEKLGKNIFFKKNILQIKKKILIIQLIISLKKNNIDNNKILYFFLKHFFFLKSLGFYSIFFLLNLNSLKKFMKFYFLNTLVSTKYMYFFKKLEKKHFYFLSNINKVSFFFELFVQKHQDEISEYLYQKERFELFYYFDEYSYYWGSHYYYENKIIEIFVEETIPVIDYWEVFEIEDDVVRFRLNIDNDKPKGNINFTRFFDLVDFDYFNKNSEIKDYISYYEWKKKFSIQKQEEAEEQKILEDYRIKKFAKLREKSKEKILNRQKETQELAESIYLKVMRRNFSTEQKKPYLESLIKSDTNLNEKKNLNYLSQPDNSFLLSNLNNIIYFNFFKKQIFFILFFFSLKKFNYLNKLNYLLKLLKTIFFKKLDFLNSIIFLKKNNYDFKKKNNYNYLFNNISKNLLYADTLNNNNKKKSFYYNLLTFSISNNLEFFSEKILKNFFYLKCGLLQNNLEDNFNNYILNSIFLKSIEDTENIEDNYFLKNYLYSNRSFKKYLFYELNKMLKYKNLLFIKKDVKTKNFVQLESKNEDWLYLEEINSNYYIFNEIFKVDFYLKQKKKKKIFFFTENLLDKWVDKIYTLYYPTECNDKNIFLQNTLTKKINIYVNNKEIKDHFTNINFFTTTSVYSSFKKFIFSSQNIFLNMKYFFSYVYESSLLELIFLKCNKWKWISLLLYPNEYSKKIIMFFNLKNYYLSNISNVYSLSDDFFSSLLSYNKVKKIQDFSKFFFTIIKKFFKKVFFKNLVFFFKKIDSSSLNSKLDSSIFSLFDEKSFESFRMNFTHEFIGVASSTFLTKDPKFLMNWITSILYKIDYRKQWKFLYNLKKNIIKLVKKFITHSSLKGINIIIRGKIGALGSVRKKSFQIKYGTFGFSRFYLKGDELFSYSNTKTGKIGVRIITAYS